MSFSDLNIVFLDKDGRKNYREVSNKIFVRSKSDIRKTKHLNKNTINISSVTGSGIKSLLNNIIKKTVQKNNLTTSLSRERHVKIVKQVLKILKSVDFNNNLDLIAFEYRQALDLSLEINQKFDIEKILDIIFKDFCIGK